MGKYAATRAMQRDRDQYQKDPSANTFSSLGDDLFDVPKNESQFRLQAFLYGFDPTGLYRGYIDQRDLANYWNDYFNNTGLSWSDIKYPSMMRGFGSAGGYGRTVFNVSKSVLRLYK